MQERLEKLEPVKSIPEPMRVLVVEDSLVQAQALRIKLTNKGFGVEVIATLSETVQRIVQPGIDVVLLDLCLPDSTGLDTFHQMHAANPSIPIVVLTGLDDEDIALEAMHNGAQDYLIKGRAGDDSIVRCLRYAIERGWTKAALQRSERRTRMIIENSLDAFVATDGQGVIIDWNRQAEQMFGWMRKEAIGNRLVDLIIPQRLRPNNSMDESRRGNDRQQYLNRRSEMVALHRDGHEFSIELAVFCINDEMNDTFCCFINNITERKAIEVRNRQLNEELERRVQSRTAELLRSNEELQQFAKIASHDIQEPVRAIEGFAKLMAKRYKGKLDEDGDQFIDYILDGTQRVQRLIHDVLTHSNIHVYREHKVQTSTASVIQEVLANLSQSISESGATFDLGELPTVAVDRSQLIQLFQNLVSNAIKYRKANEPPRIMISAERSVNDWLFSVSDNGIGIESRFADKIFDMFARLHGKTQYAGTGMGLAICKKIVTSNGGTIWVQSGLGEGSIFFFTLPVADEVKEATHAEAH